MHLAQFEAEWEEVERRYLQEAPKISKRTEVLAKVLQARKVECQLLRERLAEARRADEACQLLAVAREDARAAREDARRLGDNLEAFADEARAAREDAKTALEDARYARDDAKRLEDNLEDLRTQLHDATDARHEPSVREMEPALAPEAKSRSRQKKTWKESAGRRRGGDGYRVGDVARTVWRKLRHRRPPEAEEPLAA